MPTLSVWGHAPSYIKDVDVRTAHQLLCKINPIAGIEVNLEDIQQETHLQRKQLDALMEQDRTFSEAVHQLELQYKISTRKPDYIT